MDLDDAHHIPPPSEDVRMRLTKLFSTSFTKAIEDLYPRLTNAADWATANKPEPDLLSHAQPGYYAAPDTNANSRTATGVYQDGLTSALPRLSKFILVAAFLASTNPAKSDVRMFGRGLDEKKRKRWGRKMAGGKNKSGPTKVRRISCRLFFLPCLFLQIPQRLLGPLAFPLDRLIAILGALLEENDVDARLHRSEFLIPGEYTDMEITRVGIYAAVGNVLVFGYPTVLSYPISQIMELTSMRLLHRTSHPDRIDGPPMFKCGISYDTTLALTRQLGVPLNDLMWDPA